MKLATHTNNLAFATLSTALANWLTPFPAGQMLGQGLPRWLPINRNLTASSTINLLAFTSRVARLLWGFALEATGTFLSPAEPQG